MSDLETLLQAIPATVGFPAHLVELASDARAREEHLARRKTIRRQLGGCECGHVRGEDVCPQCDLGMALPIPRQELLEARALMHEFLETLADVGQKIGAAAREGAKEVRELAEHMRALTLTPDQLPTSGRWVKMPPNPPRARDLPRSEGNRHARRALVAQRRRAR